MLILNVAAGKQQPLEIEEAPICHNIPKLILNIDRMYHNFESSSEIETSVDKEMKLAKIQKRLIKLALKVGRNKVLQHDAIVILKRLGKTRI